MAEPSITQQQIDTLNNLYTTEPILAVFNKKAGHIGLGDLVVLLNQNDENLQEEAQRYAFMLS